MQHWPVIFHNQLYDMYSILPISFECENHGQNPQAPKLHLNVYVRLKRYKDPEVPHILYSLL